jgi:OmpA-OmpF porin, OOP family
MGATSTIGTLGDPAVDAMRAANDRAVSALTALGTSGVAADSVVQAMNLAIINFQTGSADVPAESRDVIRRSAAAIKALPSGSRIEIGGHTDNTGDSSANMSLSQRRADAVKNALVADGVSGDVLLTRGYGDTKPRASNDTEYGRFQNRRIEYAVIQ